MNRKYEGSAKYVLLARPLPDQSSDRFTGHMPLAGTDTIRVRASANKQIFPVADASPSRDLLFRNKLSNCVQGLPV